jgi:hypothetical protein
MGSVKIELDSQLGVAVGMVLDERTGIELFQIKRLLEKTDARF